MTIGAQLVSLAQDYIAGRAQLDALDTWLASHAQEISQAEDEEPSARLSGIIEVTLAEMDAGHATEDEVRTRIRTFLAELEQSRADRVAS